MRDIPVWARTAAIVSALGLIVAILLAGCGGSSGSGSTPVTQAPPPQAISVAVNATNGIAVDTTYGNLVDAGASQQFDAVVSNDPSNKGVTWTWTFTPPSGAGSMTTITNSSITYVAPATEPQQNIVVGLTATSIADPSQSATVSFTVPAIQIVVDPATTSVPAATTQVFTASANYDFYAHQGGVTWVLIPATGAGTLTDATDSSVTYHAPLTPPPADQQVTLTATSKENPASTGSAQITVPAIQVVVDPATATVPAATTQSFTASILDAGTIMPSGVKWTLAPASGAGTLSDASVTSVTFHAPAVAPDSDQTVTLTATSIDNPQSSTSAQITIPAIQVVIDPTGADLSAGGSQTFNASLRYDPNPTPGGVTWAVSPASGAGTLSDVTTTSVTYHAPATPPPSDLAVLLSATAVDNTHSVMDAAITVRAVTVAVSPVTALVGLGTTFSIQATTGYDPANAGVNWSLTQGSGNCSPACGTIASVNSLTATYTAPASLPANPKVTAVATSVTDSTKNASMIIALSTGTVQLTPTALDFGVTAGKTMSVTLTNAGSTPLALSGVAVTGVNASHFTGDSSACGSAVAPQVSCNVNVHFSGAFNDSACVNRVCEGQLQINDSSADSPQLVDLKGTICLLKKKGGCQANAAAVHAALATRARVAAPLPTGSSAVGTRTMLLADATRTDALRQDVGRRDLMVRFWYPVAASRSCVYARYTAAAVWRYFGQLAAIPLPRVTTNSCQDAMVQDGAYPVVVFTHGYTGTFTDYTFLFEELASRGYIVASVNHTFEATATALPDGQLLKSIYGSHIGGPMRADAASLSQALAVRLADLKFVAGELDRLNRDPRSPLAGHLDTARMAIAGHSLGGLAALEALQQDERFRAAISIDGMAPDDSFQPTHRPVLILDAGRELWPSEERRLWAQLDGPRYAVNLKKAEHVAPTDAVWLARGAIKTGRMSPEQTVAATRAYVTAFLDSQLLGKPVDQLLKQPSRKYPEVELTQRPP